MAEADIVAVPAWPELDDPLDPGIGDTLSAAHERGAELLSICTGAFALADAGLLDGRRATTHWQFMIVSRAGSHASASNAAPCTSPTARS